MKKPPRSKFGKDGHWDLRKVLKEAAQIVYEFMKEDGEAAEGRRIASVIRNGRLWELDGLEAWGAYDALAWKRTKPLDPALVPICQWLELLSDLRGVAQR